MTPAAGGLSTFYDRTAEGTWRCRVCQELQGHAPTCAVLALRIQVQELGSQLGFYVVTMRELLETVDGLMRGDREDP